MLKVLLINPPQKYYKKSSGFNLYVPLGLLMVGTVVKNLCNLKILDCLITDCEKMIKDDYVIYGTPLDKIELIIREFNPDIVGITVPFTTQAEMAQIVGRLCKKVNPKLTLVFGGPDVSVRYETFLNQGICDYCVIGEGEDTFRQFIENYGSDYLLMNVAGLAFKRGETIYFTPRKYQENLDQYPYPAYQLLDLESYLKSDYLYSNRSNIGKNSISIITSRGCPYNCIFCSIKLHMGNKFRAHSPEYVIGHLEHIIKTYKINNFHFEDDNFSFDPVRFEKILDEIIKLDLQIKWDTPNGIRADSLNKSLLKKIKQSGCVELTIAIESGNQKVLNNIIKKKISLNKVLSVIKECLNLDIKLNAFYVIGFPGETVENIKETLDLALELYQRYQVNPFVFFATPLYGTDLYNLCIQEGIITHDLTEQELSTGTFIYGDPVIFTKDFSKKEIKKLVFNYLLALKQISDSNNVINYYKKAKDDFINRSIFGG
ncbi:MAG: B12-binding domain-containing radical SAM protein [Firmicutes bacterium]|nr:B12-binding domain-containing radical SAM protein [Bacillota bacterium]